MDGLRPFAVLIPLLAAFLLAGCGGGGPAATSAGQPKDGPAAGERGTAEPDGSAGPGFSLTVEKEAVTFTDTETPAEVPIKLVSRGGFDLAQVSFRVEGLPEFVASEFTPITPKDGEGSAVLRLRLTTMTAPRGDQAVKIIAEGGGVTQTGTIMAQITRLGC